MIADFRSDTITKPTPGMLNAMIEAKVGDDVFGDDPTVNELESKLAGLFQMEAAMFCASGTMANQIAIRCHTQPGSEVICHKNSHIYLYEGGGVSLNSLASVRLLDGDRGMITANQVAENINNKNDVHAAITSLVSLENTMNKGGGACYELDEIREINKVCKENDLKFHLDGARLFNALVAKKQSPEDFGKEFDTISVCLSKGLGCPVGSVLLGSKETMNKARRFRKVMGGGWRQAGFLAAAGIYALDNQVERIQDDHDKAKVLAAVLKSLGFVQKVMECETNIVIFELIDSISPQHFVSSLSEKGVACVTFGKKLVRFVTHLDITDSQLDQTIDILKSFKF